MRFVLAGAALTLLSTTLACPANAGPLLDDYLNYVRLGEKTLPASGPITPASMPVGQTFAVAAGTGEIYRIGVYPNYDTWDPGESVTLTLYDSPSKAKKLGERTIPYETRLIQGIRNREKDRFLLFHLRSKLSGQQNLYFELTVSGGNGVVTFRTPEGNAYAAGQGYAAGKPEAFDFAFESHIKPIADKEANMKALWKRLNLNLPALSKVKAAVDAGDNEKAIDELVKHFRSRMELFEPTIMEPKVNPQFDTSNADRFLNKQVWKEDPQGKLVISPWRLESYWAPEYDNIIGKKPEPGIYGWQMERTFWGAYSETSNPKYARAGMDYRIQWILDNTPNPKISNIEASHEVWNELVAAGRAPGHLAYVYSRVYNFPGFSNDEHLVYFLNWFDNAYFLLDSPVGGNWLMQAAMAAYEFGQKYPEYAERDRFINWGAEKMIEVTLETVRGDGTQHEAAIKYHGMVARRLKELMMDHFSGKIKLDDKIVPVLKQNLAGLYEHMMYVLQPDSYVVMTGDSWHENYTDELAEVGRMLGREDFIWVATRGKEGKPPRPISKSFPDGGYYIMRSDYGENGLPFADARQLLLHNGGWVGGHGHWDLTSINLYAYGRTLIIDPGGMWNPPDGSPPYYWKSAVHSMLVPNGWDCTRDPGPTRWISTDSIDYLDSVHYGYANRDIDEVRRRIVFVKPDYYVVDDSTSKLDYEVRWDQNWNFLAKDVKVDPVTKVSETTFTDGKGNLIVIPVGDVSFEVARREAHVSMDGFQETEVISFRKQSNQPRYTTVLFPYKGNRPDVAATMLKPDNSDNDLNVGVRVVHPKGLDFIVWGNVSETLQFSNGKHSVSANMAVVRTAPNRISGYDWYQGTRLVFNGRELAKATTPVTKLSVEFSGNKATIETREVEPSLVVWVGEATQITVNGSPVVSKPVNGYLRLYSESAPTVLVDDDHPGFKRLTDTREWVTISDDTAFGYSYTTHETDPGRKESGAYTLSVPVNGKYRVEAYISDSTRMKSNAVEYKIQGGKFGNDDVKTTSVDQQKFNGQWVNLTTGEFMSSVPVTVTVTNVTDVDGSFPIFDAIRLIKVN